MKGLGVDQVETGEFQFEIEYAFLVEGEGTAISGLVELGSVQQDHWIDIHGLHAKRRARIAAIVADGERVEVASAGQNVALLLADLTPGHLAAGMLVTQAGGERRKDLRECVYRDHTALSA
jgi:translation elongation factor EF-Tu-like GTPase